MTDYCDCCLNLCELGKDAGKLDDNVICRECEGDPAGKGRKILPKRNNKDRG